jgi:hypothetical protein
MYIISHLYVVKDFEEDMNLSYVFFVDVDEGSHSFVKALNGEDSQYWKKAMDLSFSFYKTIKLGYLFLSI